MGKMKDIVTDREEEERLAKLNPDSWQARFYAIVVALAFAFGVFIGRAS